MTAPIPMTSLDAYRAAIAPQKDVPAPPTDRERPIAESEWHKAISHVEVDPNVQMLAERAEAARQWMTIARQAESRLPGIPGGFSPPPGTQPLLTAEQLAAWRVALDHSPGAQPQLTTEQLAQRLAALDRGRLIAALDHALAAK